MKPIGIFVHHQGRGHAERIAALVRALPRPRPVTIFCARDDIFGALPDTARVRLIPSLFQASDDPVPPALNAVRVPDTLHCAPLGWPGIRTATAAITSWFAEADPALFVTDVSAELAQLARICSVPHVAVLQHGDRSDPGHMAAYEGAAGLLAPFHEDLAQPFWPDWMRARTFHAPGIGTPAAAPTREAARARLGVGAERLTLVLSGGGGSGAPLAPISVGARTDPGARWVTLGRIAPDWHASEPPNLEHMGWVETAPDWIAAADLVISSAGNTTCHQVLRSGVPWIVIPEWRYFDEQREKGAALARAGAAHVLTDWPSSAQSWTAALTSSRETHDPAAQTRLVQDGADKLAGRWLHDLAERLWALADAPAANPISAQ
ncbi:glycosyltransferase [Roseicyclus sp. F158]|uniref:Glycosyltransferase n=1 Tax=Tropicimonas omnivorans TaxID=3075590 RepID=A0ABU3DJC2_9RHOB|nr:glycosyltransferase [Roseicyclus sp. F158]MDT0683766.1 glycosyltransferase [Roseicyclus sp. F158]